MTADPKYDYIKPLDEALDEMKHLCRENLRGAVPLIPVYEADGWHCWTPAPGGRILHLRPPNIPEGKYLAKAKAAPDDLYFPFLDFFFQRLFQNADLRRWLNAIVDDLWCLSTSMAKLEFFYRSSLADSQIDFRWMVGTEIEYIVSVLRNVYDLLQEVIVIVWKSAPLEGCDRKNQQLKKSFADMTMRGDDRGHYELMSAADIASVRKVPDWLAAYYAACATFFAAIREYRNDFVHRGENAGLLYVTDRGFAVDKNSEPFASWAVWDAESISDNRASLRPVFQYMMRSTFQAFADFSSLMEQRSAFPAPLAPGYRMFISGYHNGALDRALSGAKWWDSSSSLPKDRER